MCDTAEATESELSVGEQFGNLQSQFFRVFRRIGDNQETEEVGFDPQSIPGFTVSFGCDRSGTIFEPSAENELKLLFTTIKHQDGLSLIICHGSDGPKFYGEVFIKGDRDDRYPDFEPSNGMYMDIRSRDKDQWVALGLDGERISGLTQDTCIFDPAECLEALQIFEPVLDDARAQYDAYCDQLEAEAVKIRNQEQAKRNRMLGKCRASQQRVKDAISQFDN